MPGKWHLGVLQNAPIEHTGEVSVREHKRGFGAIVESSPYVDQTTTSLDPMSLAPWPEALKGKRRTLSLPSTG